MCVGFQHTSGAHDRGRAVFAARIRVTHVRRLGARDTSLPNYRPALWQVARPGGGPAATRWHQAERLRRRSIAPSSATISVVTQAPLKQPASMLSFDYAQPCLCKGVCRMFTRREASRLLSPSAARVATRSVLVAGIYPDRPWEGALGTDIQKLECLRKEVLRVRAELQQSQNEGEHRLCRTTDANSAANFRRSVGAPTSHGSRSTADHTGHRSLAAAPRLCCCTRASRRKALHGCRDCVGRFRLISLPEHQRAFNEHSCAGERRCSDGRTAPASFQRAVLAYCRMRRLRSAGLPAPPTAVRPFAPDAVGTRPFADARARSAPYAGSFCSVFNCDHGFLNEHRDRGLITAIYGRAAGTSDGQVRL